MELDQRATLWLEHLKTWKLSGSTQEAYCKTNSLHPKTFSNWKRRLREHLPGLPNLTRSAVISTTPVAPLVFVKLDDELDKYGDQAGKAILQKTAAPVVATAASGISLTIGGKYQVSVEADFDSTALRRLLAVLAEAQ